MTIENQTSQVVYTTDGIAAAFPFAFFAPVGSIVVEVNDGESTTLINKGDYTVTYNDPEGGTVTFPQAPQANLKLFISRIVEFIQEVDIQNQQRFYPEVIEGALDYLTMQTQQLKTETDRAVKALPGADVQEFVDSIFAAEKRAVDFALISKNWAESPTAPGDLDSKSSKTWALKSEESAASAALSSAAAGAASGRLAVKTFAELATKIVYAGPDEGQKVGAPGDVVTVLENGAPYEILASDATGADEDYTGTGGVKYKGKGAQDLRTFANVRGKINFFDLIWPSRTSEVREQIANGTFTGDLSTEWTAFHAALKAVADAGGYPHGYIPQCQIRHATDLNFGMDYLHLETQGNVRLLHTGAGAGIRFNGANAGVNGYGFRRMNIGPIEASSWSGLVGYDVTWCHKSTFERASSRGGQIKIASCVTSEFRTPVVAGQIGPFINNNRPNIGIWVGSAPGLEIGGVPYAMPCSWSTLINPVAEYVLSYNIALTETYGMTLVGGTGEGAGGATTVGLLLEANTYYAKIIGTDMEVNTGADIICAGSFNTFYGADAQDFMTFTGTSRANSVYGGKLGQLIFESGAQANLVSGANIEGLSDQSGNSTEGTRNRVENCTTRTGDTFTGIVGRVQSYTPTVSAATGTITASSATGSYTISSEGVVEFTATVTITTNGTGGGALIVGLPTTADSNASVNGQEIAVTAQQVYGRIIAPANTAQVYTGAAAYPAGDGYQIIVTGRYFNA